MNDGAKLFIRRWPGSSLKTTRLKGIVHIVHGMGEHSLRYERLAQKLCAEGFEVWAADQRGHGYTADLKINDPGKGGLLGHCHDEDGFLRVTQDIYEINCHIREKNPDIPLFLFGHSWGSFITQNYIEAYTGLSSSVKEPVKLAGCILSGTQGPAGNIRKAGSYLMSFVSFFIGKRKPSGITRILVDKPYNKPFKPSKTAFDWLSRDSAEVNAYVNDPLCGTHCSIGFYKDMLKGLIHIHRDESFQSIPKDLPIYVFSGSADPVGEMGKSTTTLVDIYGKKGILDLEYILYPDARHELLNETNREEVMVNLLSWLIKQTDKKEFRR